MRLNTRTRSREGTRLNGPRCAVCMVGVKKVNGIEHKTPFTREVEAANIFGQGSSAAGFPGGDSPMHQHNHFRSKSVALRTW